MKRVLTPFLILLAASSASGQLVPVGVSKVDITPRQPVHLINELSPAELAGVSQRLYARAIAIGSDEQGPGVLVSFDGIGVPGNVTDEVAKRLAKRKGLAREQIVICATHTHWAPHLSGLLPAIYGSSLPDDQQQRVDQYTAQLTDWIERAALRALDDRRARKLSWATGRVGFAANRRLEAEGRIVTGERLMFTYNPHAPVDHTLPVLFVHEADDKLRSVLFSYACHNVSLTLRDFSGFRNLVHGDWAGLAQEQIEADHPGCVAIATIGCGGDQRPSPVGGLEVAEAQAEEVAREVGLLLQARAGSQPISGPPIGRLERIELPLTVLPSREELQQFAAVREGGRNTLARAFLARRMLKRLEQGEQLQAALPYEVQTWQFGDALSMVFLAGEVVVDYALRIGQEFDRGRTWSVSYANATPCYIPSKRLLRRGGYEADTSMHYYGFLRRLTPAAEDLIIESVRRQLPDEFKAPAKPMRHSPPKPPDEARAAIKTPPGFRVELVAAEPLVQDPVAFDWGLDGRLWVVEMRDYPAGRDGRGEPGGRPDLGPEVDRLKLTMDGAPGGRIKVLDDVDGDGQYDRATVFLDQLSYPTGVKVWRDGILIASAPHILFARDTDGDDRADVKEVLYTGFSDSNSQHRVSFMRWGLDNWLHVVKGQRTSQVRSLRTNQTIQLGSRDLRIRPDTGAMAIRNGSTRFGHCRNDWGDWFGGGPQTGTWHYVLEDVYLQRNPHAAAPATKRNVSPPAVRVYPASPTLPRYNRPEFTNHITSACGRSIYRDDLFADQFADSLFICEPAHNLIHRRKLVRRGAVFESRRIAGESASELFAAADNWSRPVMIRTGPDGALWIADMYRHVIEHPWDIPAGARRQLDLLEGSDLGRIYRLYPEGGAPRGIPRLDRMSATQLVHMLRSPNGWLRDMAQQLLLWREEQSVTPRLEQMVASDPQPTARLHALCTLAGLAALRPPVLLGALGDPHPDLRRHALRLCATNSEVAGELPERVLGAALRRCASDPQVRVRMQLAYLLGEQPSRQHAQLLGQLLAATGSEPYLLAAGLSSAGRHTDVVLQSLLARDDPPAAAISGLAKTAVGQRDHQAVALVTTWLQDQLPADPQGGFEVLAALLESSGSWQALTGMTSARETAALAPFFEAARQLVSDAGAAAAERQRAISLLGYQAAEEECDLAVLSELLDVQVLPELKAAAIRQLGRMQSTGARQLLLDHLIGALPAARSLILEQLLVRPAWTEKLLDSAAQDRRLATLIGPAARRRLLRHRSESIRVSASSLFVDRPSQQRQAVVEHYRSQLSEKTGSAFQGRRVFERHCAACHRFQGIGKALGPDLATLTDRSADRILAAVLDPNRSVADKFISYTAATDDGRVHFGMITEQSDTAITLVGAEGNSQRLQRDRIVQLSSTGASLMPEGIEQSLSADEMAHLVAFLQQRTEGATESAWVELFNGRDLTGWVNVNGAPDSWRVRDGMIVCTGHPRGFLRTSRMYDNYVLDLEWRHAAAGGNSGIFVHADALPQIGAPYPRSLEAQLLEGDHGSLFGIRGATLVPLTNPDQKGRTARARPLHKRCRPAGQWNRYTLTSRNGTLALAVNGQLVTRAKDASPSKGHICLQAEHSEVHFRNIRLRPLPSGEIPTERTAAPADGFRPLFNGLDFDGWRHKPGHRGHWVAKDGEIHYDGQAENAARADKDLWTERSYKDFVLVADWRLPSEPSLKPHPIVLPSGDFVFDSAGKRKTVPRLDAGDSGIYLRGSSKSQLNIWSQLLGSGEINGYRTDRRLPPAIRQACLPSSRADKQFGQWNRFVITVQGDRVTLILNGVTVIESAQLPDMPAEGPIGLQHHGDPVQFRNLFLRELK